MEPLSASDVISVLREDPARVEVATIASYEDAAVVILLDSSSRRFVAAHELEWSRERGWHIGSLRRRSDLTIASGNDPRFSGRTMTVDVRGEEHVVQVSRDGYWSVLGPRMEPESVRRT